VTVNAMIVDVSFRNYAPIGTVSHLDLTQMYGPAVRCKRFVELVASGLASMYPVSSWSCFAPDHHGHQRA
jgi:hypothetical protein